MCLSCHLRNLEMELWFEEKVKANRWQSYVKEVSPLASMPAVKLSIPSWRER
jgi:hypothetical protein